MGFPEGPERNHKDLFFHLIKQEALGIIRALSCCSYEASWEKLVKSKHIVRFGDVKHLIQTWEVQMSGGGGSLGTPQGPPSPRAVISEEAELPKLCGVFVSILGVFCLMIAKKLNISHHFSYLLGHGLDSLMNIVYLMPLAFKIGQISETHVEK